MVVVGGPMDHGEIIMAANILKQSGVKWIFSGGENNYYKDEMKIIILIGFFGSSIIVFYHRVIAQIDAIAQVKDFIDLAINLGGFGLFVWYLIQKEKRQDRRMEKKDDEIKRLYEKLADRKK